MGFICQQCFLNYFKLIANFINWKEKSKNLPLLKNWINNLERGRAIPFRWAICSILLHSFTLSPRPWWHRVFDSRPGLTTKQLSRNNPLAYAEHSASKMELVSPVTNDLLRPDPRHFFSLYATWPLSSASRPADFALPSWTIHSPDFFLSSQSPLQIISSSACPKCRWFAHYLFSHYILSLNNHQLPWFTQHQYAADSDMCL